MAVQLRKIEIGALITAANEILAGDLSEWTDQDAEALDSAVEKLKVRYWGKWGGR